MILRNGLVFKNAVVNAAFRFLNYCIPTPKPRLIPPNPRKILLSNLGNMGDLFIAANAIASLKATYPNAEWGLLISPRGLSALELMDTFQHVHVYNHWYYCKTALHAPRKEIRKVGYDMAIDLQPFYPNAVPLLRSAKIPVRIGYSSGGFGASLTHPFHWSEFGKYLGALHIDHLRGIGIPLVERRFGLECSENLSDKYLVIHMCSSREEKDWKREKWIELIRKLTSWTVVLTGHGAKDSVKCEYVAAKTGCLNFCNRTNLKEYAEVLQGAQGLISVDSMGVHLAALLGVPTFVLFSGAEYPPLWLPPKSQSALMSDDSVEKIVAFAHNECE